MSIAIKAENISKAYRLGQISTGTLSRDIERWWASKRGKSDPFLKIDQNLKKENQNEIYWSLKNLNFSIEQGDSIGIVGKNGAGKSTLLKILSQVTKPTSGCIKIKGRIASLLEVGTGFHPELTGRENIFLNGAILGMNKSEIVKKFDEILDFSGVEQFVDTPVKRYSSGMYVRLAFAVAANLESEILIVDEVLAVGDSEFQNKCLGKMNDLSNTHGRTVLFVSHNLNSISTLTKKSILLEKGELVEFSDTESILSKYLIRVSNDLNYSFKGETNFLELELLLNNVKSIFTLDTFNLNFSLKTKNILKKITVGFIVKDIQENVVLGIYGRDQLLEGVEISKFYSGNIEIKDFGLMPGVYSISFGVYSGPNPISTFDNCLRFKVDESNCFVPNKILMESSIIRNTATANWQIENLI